MNLPKGLNTIWIYLSTLLSIIILAILPFNLEIAPDRIIQIIDSHGTPFREALVRQLWHQYSLGEHGEVDIRTDSLGQAPVPRRTIRTNTLSLLLGAIKEFRNTGIHASYGSSESIAIFINKHPVKWFYDGKGLESGKVIIDSDEHEEIRTAP